MRQQQLIHERLVEDVAAHKTELSKTHSQLAAKHEEVGRLNAELSQLMERLNSQHDYDVILQQASIMRKELADLRQQLHQSEEQRAELRAALGEATSKVEIQARQLANPSDELLHLRNENVS